MVKNPWIRIYFTWNLYILKCSYSWILFNRDMGYTGVFNLWNYSEWKQLKCALTREWIKKLVCTCLVVSDSFATPWIVAPQAPLSMEFSRQEYWSGLPCPPPGDLPDPGNEPGSPALQADSLPSEPPGKPQRNWYIYTMEYFWSY